VTDRTGSLSGPSIIYSVGSIVEAARVQIRFTPPPVVASPVASLDARWRLAAFFALILACAFVRSLTAAALALALALALAWLARVPLRWYLSRLAATALLLAFFVGPIPLLGGHVSTAAAILARSLALFTLACVLLVSGHVELTLKAAHAIRVPGLLVHLTLLSYRYLFVLADELSRLRVALRTRAFRNRPNLHSWRTVAAASGTLLVRGHDRAERVAHAMRCRGFDGRFRSLEEFGTSRRDVFAFALALLLAGGLVALDVACRGWMD
jgi:cobalt/nickel transport system permease protein